MANNSDSHLVKNAHNLLIYYYIGHSNQMANIPSRATRRPLPSRVRGTPQGGAAPAAPAAAAGSKAPAT